MIKALIGAWRSQAAARYDRLSKQGKTGNSVVSNDSSQQASSGLYARCDESPRGTLNAAI
jgi:hypothetical protein